MNTRVKWLAIVGFAFVSPAVAAFELEPSAVLVPAGEASASQWIWDSASEPTNRCVSYYRTTFRVDGRPKSGRIDVFFDDGGTLWVNGVRKAVGDISDALKAGANTLAFELRNDRGVSAICFLLSGVDEKGKPFYVHSDTNVRAARTVPEGWQKPDFDDSGWTAVKTLGDVLQAPWSRYFDIRGRMTTPAERARLADLESAAQALPEGLESESPIFARIVYEGASPLIQVNGRSYEPTWNLSAHMSNPYDASQTIRLGRLGVKFHQLSLYASHYDPLEGKNGKEGEGYDFSRYDENARRLLHVQDDAYIILAIRFDLNRWAALHPDEQQGYGTGPASSEDRDDYRGRPIRPSCASEPFRIRCHDIIRALGAYVKDRPWANRVAGVRVSYGVYTEWHSFGMYEAPDTGKAMTTRFREWLKAKYGPKPEFDAAEVPPVAARTTGGMMLDPVANRRTLDYYECHANAMADLLLSLAHEAKTAFPGRLVGAYYGYVFADHTPEGSNVLLDRVLASPDIDFLSNPPFYSAYARRAGGGYDPRTVTATFRRYGKLSVLEDDIRFHHLYDILPRGDKTHATQSARETRMNMRRNWLNGFFNGCGIQFCDPMPRRGERPGAFDDPAVLEAIAESRVALTRAGRPSAVSGNEIAVVVSPRERIRRDGSPKVVRENSLIYSESIHHLHRSGFAFDVLTLEDYLATRDAYRTVLFLNAFSLTAAEREALKSKLSNDATTPIWLVAPGSVTDEGFSNAAMSELVGLGLTGAGTRPRVRLAEESAAEKICGGAAYRAKGGEGRSIFVPSVPASPRAYAELFRAAGARPAVEPGPYFRRQGDVFMLHVGASGRIDVRPAERDRGRFVTELFSGVRTRAEDLSVVSDGPNTWLFKVEDGE